MDDTKELIKLAQLHSNEIIDELDLQTEKYIELQKKIGTNKVMLYENDKAISNLRNPAKMTKIYFLIFATILIFTILLIIVKKFYQ